MTRYRFKKAPGNFGRVRHNKSRRPTPKDIYEYARSFRSVYTRAAPMLKPIIDPKWAEQQEIKQLYGKAQSLAVQLAFSNELLLKAILLGSTVVYARVDTILKS